MTDAVIVPGVKVDEAVALSHAALLETAQVVAAPPPLTLIV